MKKLLRSTKEQAKCCIGDPVEGIVDLCKPEKKSSFEFSLMNGANLPRFRIWYQALGEKVFSYKDERVTTFGETIVNNYGQTNQPSHFHAMSEIRCLTKAFCFRITWRVFWQLMILRSRRREKFRFRLSGKLSCNWLIVSKHDDTNILTHAR